MIKYIIIFVYVAIIGTCVYRANTGDKKLSPKDAPDFLVKAGENMEHPDYFMKRLSDGSTIYEVKDKNNKKELSITYSSKGEFLEKEENIQIEQVQMNTHTAILTYLNENFPKAVIIDVENRQTKTETFIDVEIKDESSSTGYWELTFTPEGKFLKQELEDITGE